MEKSMIAPCGMNCELCVSRQRKKKKCPGCRGGDGNKPAGCVNCVIRNCVSLPKSGFCYDCERRCARLKSLDKRYRTKYGMSMLENLEDISESGIEAFVRREEKRWMCPSCGATLCVHRDVCLSCGARWK
ncbi:DUF3795 domain-containing protein [Christensenella intestinihominis]|uniref:DUF3795 domain-containing protein n=1 Tax=Christensenella intestinihominis TaxID=1851429 RepID=UPI00083332F2|nr:DUF3795 domain-containing protein [Christensenella intestinihominis]